MPEPLVAAGIDVSKAHVDAAAPGARLSARNFYAAAVAVFALASTLEHQGIVAVVMDATGGGNWPLP